MPEAIAKVPLLEGRREWAIFLGLATLLLTLHLAWEYREYRRFVERPFYYVWATVLLEKPGKNARGAYRILKVQAPKGRIFWTKVYGSRKLAGKQVRLKLLPSSRIGFADYLKGPFVSSRLRGVQEAPATLRRRLGEWIAAQHAGPEAAAFYRSIFLADALPPRLREKISALGASHLVALSGFHLGILWGAIFLLLRPLYRLAQRRRFPWRYDLLDLGSFALLLLAGYLWLTGMPPSLLRAYAMLLLGWGALLLGMEIVSFAFLAIVGVLLLVLFPALIFSWGFWLSMSGVFAIFLLLKYRGRLSDRQVALGWIPWGIYLLMFPVVHTLFGAVNPWQNLSPLLSLAFVPFYPLSILLHLVGMGGVLDWMLEGLWNLPQGATVTKTLPPWWLGCYAVAALGAIRYRGLFLLLLAMASLSVGWLYFF